LAITIGLSCPLNLRAQTHALRNEVDLSWPKPLPDRWIIGGLGGVCVDTQNHVLILNRQDLLEGELNAGHLAPPLIEFDSAGNLVRSWGDPNLVYVCNRDGTECTCPAGGLEGAPG